MTARAGIGREHTHGDFGEQGTSSCKDKESSGEENTATRKQVQNGSECINAAVVVTHRDDLEVEKGAAAQVLGGKTEGKYAGSPCARREQTPSN